METVKENTADEYLNKLIQRLEAEGYDVESDIEYKDKKFEYFAKRKRFEIDKFNCKFNVFVFSRFSSLDVDTLKDYSSQAFRYAVSSTIRPLSRNLFCLRYCYPVAIVDSLDSSVINYIRRKTAPPHPFIGFEMQAVYSLEAGELYYCEDSPMLGWLYFNEMQSIMNAMLAP